MESLLKLKEVKATGSGVRGVKTLLHFLASQLLAQQAGDEGAAPRASLAEELSACGEGSRLDVAAMEAALAEMRRDLDQVRG